MTKEERLQEVIDAFVKTLNDFVEHRGSLDAHRATLAALLQEIQELKGTPPRSPFAA
ncbi:hypothetical protein [Deinococcus maricopensis]|uniref:Uncharacterized protein n=1 Tax=Deinococcus maricopensis (strain DSM 21211 / LMG 22137 / NRRL B-23946 / LB-34) TaxID=709986 RepID=E8U4V3_DEIML|nr:hypothetical protein [Deinococcus maricopensis]ADV66092.1 hypothetical protein Deima_0432 [Deinococcus maricopensis DSM 21211]